MKERRKAGKKEVMPVTDIPMEHPDRSGPAPGAKTLYDIAAERESELMAAADAENARRAVTRRKQEDVADGGSLSRQRSALQAAEDDEPLISAVLYGISYTMVHFTIDVLVHHQYAQTIVWRDLVRKIAYVFPMFMAIVFVSRVNLLVKLLNGWFKEGVLFVASCALGCNLFWQGNQGPYLGVMKTSPATGTLWLFTVLEMGKWLGLANIVVVASYIYSKGFSAW